MSAWATYVVAGGTLVSVSSEQPTGLAPGLATKSISQFPDTTHVWDAATANLVTVVERPDGQAGTFYEALDADGWRWYYLVGPVAFEAEDAQAARHAQPTIAAAKTYIASHGSEAQFQVALQWSIDYRDRLSTAITAAGGTPANNQRVQKLNTLINLLGQVV